MAALAGLVAHGGAGGAIVEGALVLAIVAVLAAVWLRGRRGKGAEPEDQSRPQ